MTLHNFMKKFNLLISPIPNPTHGFDQKKKIKIKRHITPQHQ